MARGIFHKVGGEQAREAERLGFVKVDRSTAKRFYERGFPVIVTGSRVPPRHFLGGQRLALVLDKGSQDRNLLSMNGSASKALVLRSASRSVNGSFDSFMAGVDREMRTSPFGPHAVTFVLLKDYPRLDR
jgi:hypothetical protein